MPEKGAAVFEKEQQYSPYRYHSVRPLMGVFQNAVKAFGAGFCGAPLWAAAAGTD